ncbi:MAG: PEP-CTERM sorting domain-containing protein [Thermoguttaceae bacterium]
MLAFLIGMGECAHHANALTYTTLDDPLADVYGTWVTGIDGSNIVGSYSYAGHARGFLHNGSAWTTIVDPLDAWGTHVQGIAGNTIVGYYYDSSINPHGFTYNIANGQYTTLDDPLSPNGTYLQGISGNNIVGWSGARAFVYNGSFTALPANPATQRGISACGIDGNNSVGWCYGGSSWTPRGFLYNNSNYTMLDDPLAGQGSGQGTEALGVSGGNIVGEYTDSSNKQHGFLFDGSSYTTLDDPLGVSGTVAYGISGQTIVGVYVVGGDQDHGFVLVVPEPSSIVLLSVGLFGLLGWAWRRRRGQTWG